MRSNENYNYGSYNFLKLHFLLQDYTSIVFLRGLSYVRMEKEQKRIVDEWRRKGTIGCIIYMKILSRMAQKNLEETTSTMQCQ